MDTNRINGPGYYPRRPGKPVPVVSIAAKATDPWWGFANHLAFPTVERPWYRNVIAIQAPDRAAAELRMEALGVVFQTPTNYTGWYRAPHELGRTPSGSTGYASSVWIFADGSWGKAVDGIVIEDGTTVLHTLHTRGGR